jgi:hypothetical protein
MNYYTLSQHASTISYFSGVLLLSIVFALEGKDLQAILATWLL